MPGLSFANFEAPATARNGHFNIGSASIADIEVMGLAWVGPAYYSVKHGYILVSANGLRQYRRPKFKPRIGYTQANLEARSVPIGRWMSNAHIDVL